MQFKQTLGIGFSYNLGVENQDKPKVKTRVKPFFIMNLNNLEKYNPPNYWWIFFITLNNRDFKPFLYQFASEFCFVFLKG